MTAALIVAGVLLIGLSQVFFWLQWRRDVQTRLDRLARWLDELESADGLASSHGEVET